MNDRDKRILARACHEKLGARFIAEISFERLRLLRNAMKLMTLPYRYGTPAMEHTPIVQNYYTLSDELRRRRGRCAK